MQQNRRSRTTPRRDREAGKPRSYGQRRITRKEAEPYYRLNIDDFVLLIEELKLVDRRLSEFEVAHLRAALGSFDLQEWENAHPTILDKAYHFAKRASGNHALRRVSGYLIWLIIRTLLLANGVDVKANTQDVTSLLDGVASDTLTKRDFIEFILDRLMHR